MSVFVGVRARARAGAGVGGRGWAGGARTLFVVLPNVRIMLCSNMPFESLYAHRSFACMAWAGVDILCQLLLAETQGFRK